MINQILKSQPETIGPPHGFARRSFRLRFCRLERQGPPGR